MLTIAHSLSWLECFRQGNQERSQLLESLVFGQFNNAFKPNRTRFDWLSRNKQAVDAFIYDPYCGQRPTNRLWYDLFGGLKSISSVRALKQINPNLPVLVMGGTEDPISAPTMPLGKNGQQKLAEALQTAGVKDVTLTLYAGGRHEMFNEINREQVTTDLINWLKPLSQ